mgnify:CR=1 FL=1
MNNQQFAIVTGASEGIGKAISLSLIRNDFRVLLISRNQKKLNQVLTASGNLAKNAWTIPADLTDPKQVSQTIHEAIKREKHIDVLINNLGRGVRRELIETTDQEWDFLVKINLSSAFYMCRDTLRYMRQQKFGQIINIASRAGRKGEGNLAAYSALKHGLVGLTKALADSESKHGIRVNAVCPGLVSTQRMLNTHPDLDYSSANKPEDVAEAVMFLLSPAAKTMNGQIIDMYRN